MHEVLHENICGQSLNNVYVTSIQGKVEYNRPVPYLPRMYSKQASAVFSALNMILLLLTTLQYTKLFVKRKNWEAEQAFLLLMDHQKVTFVTNTALLRMHH